MIRQDPGHFCGYVINVTVDDAERLHGPEVLAGGGEIFVVEKDLVRGSERTG